MSDEVKPNETREVHAGQPEAGQRISRLSGKKVIAPIVRKEKPVVRVEILPTAKFDDDPRPEAKRIGPPKTTSTSATQRASDPDLAVLEKAVKRDDTAERNAVVEVKAKLRRTLLVQAQDAADAAIAFDREHGDYFRRLRAVLSSGELLRQAGNGSRDRINRLDGTVTRALRTMELLHAHPSAVARAIDEVTAASLVPTQTSKGQGYADTMRSPGITRVERLVATSSAEGATKSLNEALEIANGIVAALAERIGAQKLASTIEQPVTYIISAETQEERDRARPTPLQTQANDGEDWNPLDYSR